MNKEKRRLYYTKYNREHSEYMKEYQRANKDRINARRRIHAAANRDADRKRRLRWRLLNPEKVKKHAATAKSKHSSRFVAWTAKWRASKRNATPVWRNEFFINEAYELAKLRTQMLGYKWHVDHIVPLRSKIVCGLHVENNLRVIPSVINQSKGNRTWPDMP